MYLGSVNGISRQTGLPKPLVRKASRGFDHDYAAFIKWGKGVQQRIKDGNTTIITATGRPLICTKPWAAVNYSIQSPARDVFATGIIRLHQNGLGDRLRLVIHDEVILSVPKAHVEDYCRRIEDSMNTQFKGVPIVTEAKVLGKRWSK
jgi:DNA polymerase-1